MKDDEIPHNVRESMMHWAAKHPVGVAVLFMLIIGTLIFVGQCKGWLGP